MSSEKLLAWAAFAYIALIGFRYVLGARQYLACALREVKAWPTSAGLLNSAQQRILSVFDAELAAAGFRHLGFGHFSTLITQYAAPQALSVFVSESIPAYAFVRRSGAPEDARSAVLTFATEMSDGTALESVTSHLGKLLAPPSTLRVQEYPGISVGELAKQHAARVASERPGTEARAVATLDAGLEYVTTRVRELREVWRQRRWVVATSDAQLDRFTLRGAFGLANYSMRVARGAANSHRRWPRYQRKRRAPCVSRRKSKQCSAWRKLRSARRGRRGRCWD